jgi:hypothetical protein
LFCWNVLGIFEMVIIRVHRHLNRPRNTTKVSLSTIFQSIDELRPSFLCNQIHNENRSRIFRQKFWKISRKISVLMLDQKISRLDFGIARTLAIGVVSNNHFSWSLFVSSFLGLFFPRIPRDFWRNRMKLVPL